MLCLGITLCILFFSCVPQHKIVYVQSPVEKKDAEYSMNNGKDLQIQPFDMLYINVASLDQPGYNFFNQEKQNYSSISDATLAILSYTVNDSGNVHLPILGSLHLQGQTLEGASRLIKDAVKGMLSNPMVSVRFVNSTITILGEVGKPGTYPFTNDHLTIFRAVGMAGDINEYGDRKNVTLIREKDKKIHKYNLDLTTDDLFKSDFYFLHPNDILYIQPLRIRRFGMKEYPFALVVSAITTVFLALYYVKK